MLFSTHLYAKYFFNTMKNGSKSDFSLIMLVLLLIGVLYVIVLNTNASQDAYIKVDSKNTNLCFSYDDYNNPVCNGSSIIVEGTKDGTLYILPRSEIRGNDSLGTQITYIVNKPLNWLLGVSMIIGFFIMAFAVIYAAVLFLSAFINRGG